MIVLLFVYLHLIRSLVSAECIGDKKVCYPSCHHWQPYYNEIPPNAFVAATTAVVQRNHYVAKVIPIELQSWSIPVEFDKEYAAWAWKTCCVTRIDRFIEILIVMNLEKYFWREINSNEDMEETLKMCCLVEGGVVYAPEQHFAYVGRICRNSTWYIGVALLTDIGNHAAGLHSMDGWDSIYFETGFEVLHYGCMKIECHHVKDNK